MIDAAAEGHYILFTIPFCPLFMSMLLLLLLLLLLVLLLLLMMMIIMVIDVWWPLHNDSTFTGVLVDTEGFSPVDFFKLFFPGQPFRCRHRPVQPVWGAACQPPATSIFYNPREFSVAEMKAYVALQIYFQTLLLVESIFIAVLKKIKLHATVNFKRFVQHFHVVGKYRKWLHQTRNAVFIVI